MAYDGGLEGILGGLTKSTDHPSAHLNMASSFGLSLYQASRVAGFRS